MTRQVLVVDDQRIFLPRGDTKITHETTSQDGYRTLLLNGPWSEIWLDHDLGMESEGSGYDLVEDILQYLEDFSQHLEGDAREEYKKEIVREDLLIRGGRVYVHTMNPVGGDRMVAALTRYFDVARIDPTPYLDFDAMYAQNRNPYLAGPRR